MGVPQASLTGGLTPPPQHTLLSFALRKKKKKTKPLGVNLVVVKFKEASAELGGISLSTK